MSLIVDEHRQLLADRVRVAAYRQAIGATVRSGDVVLDLGAGTGILGLLACRAGAGRVYSVEEGSIVEVARAICRANGFEDRVTFVRGLSTELELPEKVDVVVTDQVGRFGFEAGLFEYLADARARFLKPGGCTIPSAVELSVAPVECPEHFARVAFWDESCAGLDLRPARALAANTGYPVRLHADHLLADPVRLGSLDAAAELPPCVTLEGTAVVTRDGTLHGIGGWCSASLADGVVMSNSPLAAERIARSNVYLPIERGLTVRPGDRVRLRMQIVPVELLVRWTVEVCHARGGPTVRFAHSTLGGMPIAREDLLKTRPDSVPRLSARGWARLSVLSLCDGERALAEIEREVYRRHPEFFRSFGEAAGFVAEVVSRYAT